MVFTVAVAPPSSSTTKYSNGRPRGCNPRAP